MVCLEVLARVIHVSLGPSLRLVVVGEAPQERRHPILQQESESSAMFLQPSAGGTHVRVRWSARTGEFRSSGIVKRHRLTQPRRLRRSSVGLTSKSEHTVCH
jgi:hypothetical protein